MRRGFAEELRLLLEELSDRPLTLGDILAQTSEGGFSLAIGLLTFPFLFPMPPGITTILGGGTLLLSLQMAMGKKIPWLPKRIAKYRFPHRLVALLLKNLHRFAKIVSKISRRRLTHLVDRPILWRINGLCIAWLAILLMLPVPLTNPIPTVGILLFVIASLERDGLLMCVSYISTFLITLFFGGIGYLIWQLPHLLPNWFWTS
ncbi:exopolysaccharide biosynthesis protein [Merismopedia glauca]|uniref:Exopolysaccharide biosynthesis protein n=1 Tax=Merismopedia glauca CCAP 1448/3 TaxID=1296344 RepID=A0A2T1C3Z3_9CYAN|nr:exopolysaccharide biosynthesis protein [Merismopedia glauca]PSB02971.1 exopolysaccharide biosynthesis protein [Merismopedia glauca CCAP 1448/3]